MDNANPVSLSVDEIRKRNEERLKGRKKKKNLWIPDSRLSDGLSVREIIPGITSFDEFDGREEFDSEEVFDLLRNLTDPEHPLTLEQLSVVSPDLITVDDKHSTVDVQFTPTIPHCSQATLIGLMIRVKLSRCLPSRFKISIRITPGTHNTEDAINKQLNDKERVAAALENPSLLRVINRSVADDLDEVSKWEFM